MILVNVSIVAILVSLNVIVILVNVRKISSVDVVLFVFIVIANIDKIVQHFYLLMKNYIKSLSLCKKDESFLFVINNRTLC